MSRFFSFFERLGKDAYDLYDIFHTKLIGFIILNLLLIALGIFLSSINWLVINGVLGVILILGSILVHSHPRVVTAILGAGAVKNPTAPLEGASDIASKVTDLAGRWLMWMSFFFLICATIHLERNVIVLAPVILLALMFIFLADPIWKIKSLLPRRIAFTYAVLISLFYVAAMISPTTYKHLIGIDPVQFIRVNRVESKLCEIEILQRELSEAKKLSELKKIEMKLKSHQILSKDELKFLQKSKEKNSPLISKAGQGVKALWKKVRHLWADEEEEARQRILAQGDEFFVKSLKAKTDAERIALLRKAARLNPAYKQDLWNALPWKEVPGSRTEVIGKGFGPGDNGMISLPIILKKGDKYVIISRHFQMKKYFGNVCKWVSYYGTKERLCSWVPNGDPFAFRAEKGEKAVVFTLRKDI